MNRTSVIGLLLLVAVTAYGCGDDDDDDDSSTGGSGGTSSGGSAGKGGTSSGGEGGSGTGAETLCEKYGGTDAVGSVVEDQVIGAIAADCRISPHFTSLSEDSFTHVVDCLSIQVESLFECEGVVYEGSESSVGRPCRTMEAAHEGLGISAGDFDALVEDVVSGMQEAGIEEADINSVAPTLLGLEPDIVEDESVEPTQSICEGGAPGAGGAG